MLSKIAHAAERKAFEVAIDQVIKAGSSEDRDEKLDKLIDMAGKLLKDTSPESEPESTVKEGIPSTGIAAILRNPRLSNVYVHPSS